MINAGTAGIYVAAVSNFSGGISNSGTISANATGISVAAVSTFAGGISNNGVITAARAGILVGGKTPSGVVLYVSTFSGNISNSGTITAKTGVVIAQGVSFTAGAAIVNTGNISGLPSGAAIDASNASSAVTIDQNGGTITGAIKLSANADALNIAGGSIAGNIVGQGTHDTINFNLGARTFTYGGAFGFSTINQVNINSGTVILNGANSAANVDVVGGTLEVGDSAHATATLISTNPVLVSGTLEGYGTVIGGDTIESGGNLLPGDGIGTLTINGPLVFSAGSTFTEQLSPTQHSLIEVIGGAAGTVKISSNAEVELTPQLGTYTAAKIAIMTSSGTITGQFNPTVTFTGTTKLNDVVLSYDANDIYLSYQPFIATLQFFGANQNQANVGNAINNFILAGNTPPADFQPLAGLSNGALLDAFSQLSGEGNPAFIQAAFEAGDLFLRLITNPYNFDRGGNGTGAFGPAPGYAEETRALPEATLAFAGVAKAPPKTDTFDSRYRAWGAAYGGGGNIDGNAAIGSHNTNASAYGFAGGLDYRADPNTVVGFALGGGGTGWGLAQGIGGGYSNMFQAGLYGSTRSGPVYLTAGLAYAWHEVNTDRHVTLVGPSNLTAKFNANVVSGRIESGYRYNIEGYGVVPYAAIQAQWMNLPSYSETATFGSPAFALSYSAQNAKTTRSELGLWADRFIWLDKGMPVQIYGRAAWTHDFSDTNTATPLFQALPGASFLVTTAKPDPDGALLSAGAKYSFGNGWSVMAKFDGDFTGNSSIYSGSGTLAYIW
ncbi:MAG TPA: autotransporter domain-containing protein [Xanthobacteraceae bacterium]|nr:autotransporter domain-containing protein [Xanthobacteraceae bacterium]